MAYVFGIPFPLNEFLLVITLILLIAVIFIFFQMIRVNQHVKILEDTTVEIRKYEEQEMDQVKRFEVDMKQFESDEAQLFVAKVVPAVTKLENYVANELLKGKDAEKIKVTLSKKGVNNQLATKIVNTMTYYLEFFHKLPKKRVDEHVGLASKVGPLIQSPK